MARVADLDSHIGRRLRLRDLHVFFTVVQSGSMAKAANQLRVTQPAVSQVIAALEHALGVTLLDRGPQGVEPTIYGRALLKGGAVAFDDLKQTIKEIDQISREKFDEAFARINENFGHVFTARPGAVAHSSSRAGVIRSQSQTTTCGSCTDATARASVAPTAPAQSAPSPRK